MNKSPWKTVRLEKVAEIQTGISKSASRKLTDPIEVPYLRVANVQDGHLDLSVIKHISIERKNLERYTLKTGDVLLTEGGDFDKLGRGTVWNNEIESCVHQNHVFSVRTDASVLLPEFLSILTASSYGKRYFISCSKQSTNLASINSTQLKQFPVLLPSLDVQKSIVSASKLWDNAIEKTEALIAAKEKQFEWLLNNLIEDDFKSCKKTLSEYASIAKKEKILSADGEKLLTVKLHCKGIEPNTRDIKVVLSSKGRPYYQRLAGEFLIGRQNFHNGGFGIVPSELDGFIASNAITTLELNQQKLIPEYLFFHFSRKNYYLRVGHIMDGTGQKELSDKQIMKLPISAPSIKVQQDIVLKLSSAKEEIKLLQTLLDKYRSQKRGLMQKLLTGEWQVSSSQPVAEDMYQEASA